MPRNHFSLLRPGLTNPALFITVREVRGALEGCNSVLDVGSGTSSPLRFLSVARLVGVDGHQPSLDLARQIGTHDEYHLGDVLDLDSIFSAKSFDACVAMDLIEHLPKEHGWKLLQDMESLARKRVVVFTPNGFMPQKSQDGDLQEHLSGWTSEEFRSKGYKVHGMLGPKSMRGEYHHIKGKPRALWAAISTASHYLSTRAHPEKSAAVMAVKHLD